MKSKDTEYKFEEFCNVIDGFSPCVDDYLYCYDLAQDLYHISERALDRFQIPENHFSNVMMTLKSFIYEDDAAMLIADLEKMVEGEKDEHNIEYRWIGKDGSPIWINCRGRVLRDENGVSKYMIGCVNEIGKNQKAGSIALHYGA